MSRNGKNPDYLKKFLKKIDERKNRKMNTSGEKNGEAFVWLRILGIIGWSVIIPALSGVALGVWIDKKFHSGYSFSLILMFSGFIAGCMFAWNLLIKIINKKDK